MEKNDPKNPISLNILIAAANMVLDNCVTDSQVQSNLELTPDGSLCETLDTTQSDSESVVSVHNLGSNRLTNRDFTTQVRQTQQQVNNQFRRNNRIQDTFNNPLGIPDRLIPKYIPRTLPSSNVARLQDQRAQNNQRNTGR